MPHKEGGVGNPFEEEFFFRGYRDTGQGEERPKDVVFDPLKPPPAPEEHQKLDDFFDRLRRELKSLVFFNKRPAHVEPPFFARPLIKVKNGLAVAPGAEEIIFDRTIEDRQRAIVSAIGIDVAPILPLYSGLLEFWFQQDDETIPLFDDQTAGPYGNYKSGRTTVLPGSVGVPWCMFSNGIAVIIKGKKRLTFRVQNNSGVTIVVRGILGLYQYWLAGIAGAAEQESAEIQQ